MLDIFLTLLVFHLEISGTSINELHPEKILFISSTFSVFQLEISGKYNNDLQEENI